MRRSHLAGALGAALLDKVLGEGWARREAGSRALAFSPKGRQAFARTFLAEPVDPPLQTAAARPVEQV